MRAGYSVLREIDKKNFIPEGNDYGLSEREFENFIFFLENKGFLERVLRVNDFFSIKPARLTLKGKELLEELHHYEASYPADRSELKKWVEIEKKAYSNGAFEDY
ncbi:DNA-binding MarR family transcriptional regulator [Chryseomicrobium aureum]|uniref:hypothetical protein n=1 Tax=Chryseomicrobium aureum TaxID=1441723 RepID=UPI00195AB9CE|nr:hypothetical protein [Chryseomicrobium aureum]MBM7707691.1 DNA-binding MarR family transcriptional regulator [Chryseomicrobium aureum]